jgi:hypothetical protein
LSGAFSCRKKSQISAPESRTDLPSSELSREKFSGNPCLWRPWTGYTRLRSLFPLTLVGRFFPSAQRLCCARKVGCSGAWPGAVRKPSRRKKPAEVLRAMVWMRRIFFEATMRDNASTMLRPMHLPCASGATARRRVRFRPRPSRRQPIRRPALPVSWPPALLLAVDAEPQPYVGRQAEGLPQDAPEQFIHLCYGGLCGHGFYDGHITPRAAANCCLFAGPGRRSSPAACVSARHGFLCGPGALRH